jgi:hypothetical protein
MDCKYCNRAIYFGILGGRRYFFNSDDKHLHQCSEYLESKRKQERQDTAKPRSNDEERAS